jgi:parallel beta-helix repeat protein
LDSSLRRLAPAALLVAALLATPLVGTASAAHVGCGQTITQSTVLDSNVGPCSGDGIIIGADNITLDLNGFTVSGTAAPGEGAGILLDGRSGVSVRNVQVTLFDAGVVIAGGSRNTVNRILAQDNIGNRTTDYGDGIALFSSSNNTIMGNVVRHNGLYDGIGLVGNSDNNLIDSNAVQDNNVQSTPTLVDDMGIRVEGPGAGGNTVRNNSVTGNGLDGIIVFPFAGNTGNTVQRNVTRGNGFHDKAHRRGNGIVVGAASTLIENNISESNAASGIRVNGQNNTIRFNRATNNALSVNQGTIAVGGAFDLQDTQPNCDNNVWQSNTYGTRNVPCIN